MSAFTVGYFVGSLSSKSINRKLAQALVKLAPENLTLREIPIKDLPLYSQDYDEDYPPTARALKQAIAEVDAVLFVTPEYNRSIPGILKNAIDWPSRPFGESVWTDKPGAIAGATGGVSGTAAAQVHLRSILPVVGVAVMGRPEIYFQSRPGAIDDALNFTDERVKTNLNIWVDQFVQWIGRFAEPRSAEVPEAERKSA